MPNRAHFAEEERTYELPGQLRGEPVAVNATVGGDRFDGSELRHLKPAPNGLYAVHSRALLRIASSVITTTAQIDALNWPG